MINISKLLKDAPKDMKLYSPLFGEVKFKYINDSQFGIVVEDSVGCSRSFDKYGRYFTIYNNAECLLFPSEEVRTWEEWKVPKPHYDIVNFHAGMPVLVRETNLNAWEYVLFSHCYIGSDGLTRFNAGLIGFTQCIPFNKDTEHLLGTTNMPDEYYINW